MSLEPVESENDRERYGDDYKSDVFTVRANLELGYDIVGDKSSGDWSIVDCGDWNGRWFDASRERVTGSKVLRND